MIALATGIVSLTALTGLLGAALLFAARRLPESTDTVVEAIDALLPQTQCAQCGYPGCRPYAEAMAAGAPIDLCPPGGPATVTALGELLGRAPQPIALPPPARVAAIREPECIGCYLCVNVCPVDAIVGAPHFLHTVLERECTGCELCIPVCPVDCIDLMEAAGAAPALQYPAAPHEDARAEHACIRCGACIPVCPVALDPAELHWRLRADDLERAAQLGLNACIACNRCDRACPSGLPLAAEFGAAQDAWLARLGVRADAARARQRFDARRARLRREAEDAAARRAERLAQGGARTW